MILIPIEKIKAAMEICIPNPGDILKGDQWWTVVESCKDGDRHKLRFGRFERKADYTVYVERGIRLPFGCLLQLRS